MKPISTSYSLPLSCLPYGFAFCSPRHRGSITELCLFLDHVFSLQKCCFLLLICSSYKILAKDQLTLQPKRNKALQKIHTVCMYQRLESNVLWPIWLQKGANTHFLFSLTQKIKLIFSEIDDRLVRGTLLTLAGCWLACDLVSQSCNRRPVVPAIYKKLKVKHWKSN